MLHTLATRGTCTAGCLPVLMPGYIPAQATCPGYLMLPSTAELYSEDDRLSRMSAACSASARLEVVL